MKQRTLSSSFTLKGKGLHTGLELVVTFNPAPVNHGYKIKRVDVEGQPVIDAIAENVVETTRGTVLGANDVKCSTVEHAFAALYAFGIDNVLVEVNGPEFPILDGSATPYVNKIKEIGMVEQEADKEWLIVSEPIEYTDEATGSHVAILPADDFALSVTIDFNSQLMPIQTATLRDINNFETEISSARTFVFVREIEILLSLGLIKGGDLDNAVVIYERETTQENMDKLCKLTKAEWHDAKELGYIQHKPLVWENEPARHKLLDLIGDLSLVGKPIKGHIVATKPGHTINNKFARLLKK
ncbi:MAG: UDP-3-O-[Bacteroidaceae bacterium]|nr:UDP-3-O-[3-hydroxymyristoyl] N-acetylglucosamine deacetylase [Bacteroidaceae bacterium]